METPQSIRLIDDVVAGDRFLGLVLQRSPEVENPTPADLYQFGCAGRVPKMLKFPDGTVRVLVEGLRRFRDHGLHLAKRPIWWRGSRSSRMMRTIRWS